MDLRRKLRKRHRAFNPPSKVKADRIERIAYSLEHSRFLDYVEFTKRPRLLILRNFIIGASRGVGLTIGTGLVIVIGVKILQNLISINIPYLTEILTDFVRFIKAAAVSVPGVPEVFSDSGDSIVSGAINDAVNDSSASLSPFLDDSDIMKELEETTK